MANISILKTELQNAAYSTMTDAECLASLTAKNISAKQNITNHDIRKYLALQGKLMVMEASTLDSAKTAVRYLDLFDVFAMDEVAVEMALTAMLDALIVDALIDATDKANILAMGDKMISKAESLSIGSVSIWEIEKARSEV